METLGQLRVDRILAGVRDQAIDGNWEQARHHAQPLVDALGRDHGAADALLQLIAEGAFDYPDAAELLSMLVTVAPDFDRLVQIGHALDEARHLGYLNAAAPDIPLFANVLQRLLDGIPHDPSPGAHIATALAARLAGRQYDDTAESAHRAVMRLTPNDWTAYFDYGLFLKTRGRFGEGADANLKARVLAGSDVPAPVWWNLGICATGCGRGDLALQAWSEGLGISLDLDSDGRPAGVFEPAKVRLAERPLAARGAVDDTPGIEESIWIERCSPCHGIVRSATYHDALNVDYGDVVLFDGAPITHHEVRGEPVPVFPHLVTLKRSGYRIFRFHALQKERHQVGMWSEALPDDAVIYTHTEQIHWLCPRCYDSGDSTCGHTPQKGRLVAGKVCIAPTTPSDIVQATIDRRSQAEATTFLCPELCLANGHTARADVEARRVAMLESARRGNQRV